MSDVLPRCIIVHCCHVVCCVVLGGDCLGCVIVCCCPIGEQFCRAVLDNCPLCCVAVYCGIVVLLCVYVRVIHLVVFGLPGDRNMQMSFPSQLACFPFSLSWAIVPVVNKHQTNALFAQ